jgi:outer membrane protein assembly factor BamB
LSQNTISNNLIFKTSNILIDKKDVFVSSNNGDLFNFNVDTGEIKWSQKLSSIQNHISTDKYIFVLTENGFIVVFNKINGTILWSLNLTKFSKDSKTVPNYYGLLLASNSLYVTSSNGDIYKISANEGKYIAHKKINNDLSRAPIIADNKIFILNRSSELIILN